MVYLFLAFFWIAVAVVFQVFWETLERHAFIPVPRHLVSVLFFVLFSYCFIRWRVTQVMQRTHVEDLEPPPRPRVVDPEPDSTFDFSKPDPKDEPKKPA